MRLKKSTFKTIMYWILVILPIYKDSPLSQYLGFAGYTLLVPVSYIIFSVICLWQARVVIERSLKPLYKLGIWIFIVGELAVFFWFIMTANLTALGNILPLKALIVSLEYLAYIIYMSLILYCIKDQNLDYVFKPIFFTLILLVLIMLFEIPQLPFAFRGLHFAGGFPYYRIRLLTMEASGTAMLIFVYGLLSIYYGVVSKERVKLLVAVICTLILLSSTDSKTLISVVGIATFIYILFRSRQLDIKWVMVTPLFIVLVAFVILVIYPRLSSDLSNDIDKYTSTATRMYTGILGLGIGTVFPFGIGGGIYPMVLQSAMATFLPFYSTLYPNYNMSEIKNLISSTTDNAVTAKSSGAQYNMYWGIVGTSFLIFYFHRISKKLVDNQVPAQQFIRSIFWSTIIIVIFIGSWDFEFWLLVALIIYLPTIGGGKEIVK
ncbi:hypothetical protein [Lactobacillus delbrueckii]|uniref:hypothetical protein n=1 Tax=Lactobacillus delbrueckii TaxID=1584 RepID=UPI003A836231